MPESRECGTCKTVKAGFWHWLSGKSTENLSSGSLFARERILKGISTTSSMTITRRPLTAVERMWLIYDSQGQHRANVAHIRQPRPDSGLDFQEEVLLSCFAVPSSLESGSWKGYQPLHQ